MGPYLKSAGAGAMLVIGPLFLAIGLMKPHVVPIVLGLAMIVAAVIHFIDPH